MLRTPLLDAVAALSLALGIAANTTSFRALDALLLRPLPYPDADQLVRVRGTNPERGWDRDAAPRPTSRTCAAVPHRAVIGGPDNAIARARLRGRRCRRRRHPVVVISDGPSHARPARSRSSAACTTLPRRRVPPSC